MTCQRIIAIGVAQDSDVDAKKAEVSKMLQVVKIIIGVMR